jgi:glucose/arabinose dehydrogenase
MKRIGVVAVAVVILAAGCTSSNQASPSPSAGTGSANPSAGPGTPSATANSTQPNLSRVKVRLVQIATLEQPVAFADRAGDAALYIAEKTGKVVAIRGGRVDPTPVLDLSGQVSHGGEQGLLGLAFSSDGRFLYVNFTDQNGNTNVTEFAMREGRAVSATGRLVLFVRQPFANHNGGDLAFGPDGYLYIGLGDGGSEGDPLDNGQRLDTLLGKMLRIDPREANGHAYAIPPANPFVGRSGVRPEIWAYGLRNPWRYTFDRQTGDLWIGDVGQNTWEEIDVQPAGSKGGQNYGWNRMEGNHPYRGSAPAHAVGPIYEYNHSGGGCAVVGGYVYRGSAIPELRGAYLFGDNCLAPIVAIVRAGGRIVQRRTLPISVASLSSFGEDRAGELYALSLGGAVYRIVPQG